MSLINAADFIAPAPRYRERPRIDLASGAVAGQSIQLSDGVPAAFTIDLACRLAKLVAMPVSVRVGAPLTALPGLVADGLACTGVEPGLLEVRVCGSTIQQAAVDSLLALSAVRDQGVDVALQDFGGPGTLELVQYLPLSAVILKPTQIIGIPGSAAAATLLHTLLGMARDHGLRVVATGIDSEAQRALLSGLGCTQGEGKLFGLPELQQPDGLGTAEAILSKH